MIECQTAPGVGTRTATLEWCDCGSLDSLTYPSGFKIIYERNDDGQITAIKKLDGGTTITLASYEYDDAARLSTRTLANGVVTSYTFDAVDNVTSITMTKAGATIWSNTYGYDDLNRRTYTKWADGKGDSYNYDATSQVIGVKYSGTNPEAGFGSIGAPATTATWDYDIAGNRTAQVVNSATTSYTVNDINQYVTVDSGSLSYNTRGDLLTHGDWTLGYDAFGHLISATGTGGEVHKYFYDAGGTRIGKQLHGEDPIFSFHVGFDRLEDFDTGTTDIVSYIHEPGIDRPLAMIDAASDITFFHQDVLGNVVALTNQAGTLIQQYRYEVWGKPSVFDANNQQLTTNALSPFLFTAREYDPETGLYHYRARAYSPELGRFLQFDPIDFAGRDRNHLRYVSNRSLEMYDPTGLACCDAEQAQVSVAEGYVAAAENDLNAASAARDAARSTAEERGRDVEIAMQRSGVVCAAAAVACGRAQKAPHWGSGAACGVTVVACLLSLNDVAERTQRLNAALDVLESAISDLNHAQTLLANSQSALSAALAALSTCLSSAQHNPACNCPH